MKCWICRDTGHVDTEGHLPGGGTVKCPVCKKLVVNKIKNENTLARDR